MLAAQRPSRRQNWPNLALEDLEYQELAATDMESVCRGIVPTATLLYWIRVHMDGLEDWDFGSLIDIIGGWLAKIIPRGLQAINAHGKSLEEGVCWAPIDSAPWRRQRPSLFCFFRKRRTRQIN